MNVPTAAGPGTRAPDPVASLTLMLVALIALGAAWTLPWWSMEARAPQYGQRVLVVRVNPRAVTGDVFEIDSLGHYVGIRPMAALGRVEKKLAPLGLLAAFAGILATPWLRRRWLRLLAVLPALAMPLVFLADLNYWMDRSVTDRDPAAALNLAVTQIDAKLLGKYAVGQFAVHAKAEGGLYVAGLAALLGIGLVFAVPLGRPRVAKDAVRLAAAAAVALSVLLPPGTAAAKAIVLGPGETVATAIALAAEGDTIVIPPGIHREHVVLDKRVVLLGRPGAVLDGGGEGTVLRIRASGAEVRGLVVRGSGDNFTREDTGIRIERAASVRVADTRVEDCLFGVFVTRSDRCAIERTVIVGKDLAPDRRGDGIRLWYSHGCQILGNEVDLSRDVIIWYSRGTRVEDNAVTRGRYGLHYMYSDDNAFRRNRFEDNLVGASIMYSRGIELEGNSFSFSNGPGAYGLLVKESNDVFIRGNRFVGNATALFFDDSPQAADARAEVKKNLIARNDVGVALQPHTRRIEFSENAFVGNSTQVQMLGTGTAEGCLWSIGGRGNYWSDAVVYDRDGDGVSDLPFEMASTYEVLADRYPALAFFQDTPAAQAIDLGARLFPLFAPRPKLRDDHPLAAPAVAEWMRRPEGSAGGAGLALSSVALVALAAAVVALGAKAVA